MDVSKINNNLVDTTISQTQKDIKTGDFKRQLEEAMDKKDPVQLKKVCLEFEGIFMNMIFKGLKNTINKQDLIPNSAGKEMFESMYEDEIIEKASQRGSLNLGEILYKQLSKQLKEK